MKTIKMMDVIIGRMMCLFLSRPFIRPLLTHNTIERILVIRPGGIGDAVLLVPALKTLSKNIPHAVLDVLTEDRNSSVFSLIGTVNRVFRYNRPKELLAAVRGNYDMVIDTEQWHRLSAIVTRFVGAPLSIGYATNERRKMFTDPIPYSQDDYEVMSFLNLIAPITGDRIFDEKMPFLTIPESCSLAMKHRLREFGNRNVIAIFPGGSISERKWGSGRYHQTAKLLGEQGYSIVVVGGKDDVSAGAEIISGISGSLNLCGKISLPETAAVLKESSLLITGDSGIMHIGYGLGIKVLALFGPGREKKWAPRGGKCRVINKRLPCSPCTTFGYTAKCKTNALCMSSISVEEVFTEAMLLLGEE